MIESIMYLGTSTRPNLIFVISFLAQFSSTTNKQHVAGVILYLRYIKGTWHLTLLFPYGCEMFIAEISDSNYGNSIDSGRSVSVYLCKLENSTISWRSQIQNSVSTSTTEAKYIALTEPANYFLWLKTALKDL
jgi:hypothetical protein